MRNVNNKICKFCGQEKKLIKAHIIPKNFYLNRKHEKYQLVNLFSASGRVTEKQSGAYDKNILCGDCDNKILGEFDKEGYRVLLQEINNHLVAQYFSYKKVYLFTSADFNYDKLRKFFISVLWRASISQLEEFRDINLGLYKHKVLQILKGEQNYESLFKIIILKEPPNRDTNYMVTCAQQNQGDYFAYYLVIAGYHIIIIDDEKHIPADSRNDFMSKDSLRILEDPWLVKGSRKSFYRTMKVMYQQGFSSKKRKSNKGV